MVLVDVEVGTFVSTHPCRDLIGGDSSEHYCRHVAWSDDGSRFAYTGVCERVILYDGATGAVLRAMDPGRAAGLTRSSFGAPAFSPDGGRAAALHNPFLESQTRVWDLASGREVLSVRNEYNRERTNGTSMRCSACCGSARTAGTSTWRRSGAIGLEARWRSIRGSRSLATHESTPRTSVRIPTSRSVAAGVREKCGEHAMQASSHFFSASAETTHLLHDVKVAELLLSEQDSEVGF